MDRWSMGPLIIQKSVEYYLNGPKLVVLSLATIYYNAPIEKGPLTLNIDVSSFKDFGGFECQ